MLRIFTLIVCLLAYICGTANAAPTVTGASVGSTSITVTGSGFGSTGPNVVIFDDFDAVGASNGGNIALTADVGAWDGAGTYSPTYDNIPRSGTYSARMSAMDPVAVAAKVYKNFSPVTEIFISYAVQVPTGTWFPHTGRDGTHDGGDGLAYLSTSAGGLFSGPTDFTIQAKVKIGGTSNPSNNITYNP